MRLRGLTDTREGRLVVIGVVGGSLLLAATVGNIAMSSAADRAADDTRVALRRELATVSDATIAAYPATAREIELVAVEAVAGRPAQVLGSARPDDEVVVAVQSGSGWQIRCIRAELRGAGTVLTYVEARPC
ncbi:MAG TPA: hypothetical protein VFI47_00970 [Acidimicrobiales bacterium]|nr:hypothetical protein [Acidimicrobiales bacterium]